MDFFSDFIEHWWDLCVNHYKVNPYIFISMYSVKSVIFWWTMIIIGKNIIKRNWNVLPGWVMLNVSTNVSPWVYIWIYGENLPFWYSYMVYFIGGWAICYLLWDIYRRIKALDAKKDGVDCIDNSASCAETVKSEEK